MKKIFVKERNKTWLHLSLLIIIIGIAYLKIIHAGFIAWDDNEYIVNNKDIDNIGIANISAWFSRFYIGNYHPLTIFSYAIDKLIGGKQPFIYHLTNLLFHSANSIIIYFLINRLQPNKIVGLFVALIFAVHPLQTESVSWVAERKTLLCAFFYFLALLQYTFYVVKPSVKAILIVCLLGVAAMLSKGVAVALPLSLLAIDIWMVRDLKKAKPWLEKIPLLAVALIIGIVAVRAQDAGKFLNLHPEYNWLDTFVFAGYAYVQYIVHFLVPYEASVIYPYPQSIGFLQYFFLIISASIVLIGVISYRKKWYLLCGGIVFFTVNIVLLLQFIQFGEFLMADRYLYIACIGILFPLVFYLFEWLQKTSSRNIAVITNAGIALIFLFMTFQRNDIWLSDFNFFNAILDTFPNSTVAQYSVGGLYMRQGKYTEAEKHIDLAVQIDPGNYKAWYNKGVLLLREKKVAESLDALNKCLAINEYPKAYFSRALLYQGTGQPALALADVEKVLADQPQNARAYYIKADCLEQEGNINDAIVNYDKSIEFEHTEPLFYIRRGLAYAKTKQEVLGLDDLNTAVTLDPENGEALYFRGIIKFHNGQNACDDFKNALKHGYMQAQEAMAKTCNQ